MRKYFIKNLFIIMVAILVYLACFTNLAFADSYDGPEPRGEAAYIDAKDNYANIRKGAGTQYEVIEKLDNGTEVRVFGSIKNKKGEKWYCIGNDNHFAESKYVLKQKCGWTHESNIKMGEKKK